MGFFFKRRFPFSHMLRPFQDGFLFGEATSSHFFTVMMNCFCSIVDRRKAFSLISSRGHCQRSSPSRISDMPQAGFQPAQNLSSGLVEWSCAVVITTTPRRHYTTTSIQQLNFWNIYSSEQLLFLRSSFFRTVTYLQQLFF